MTSPWKRQPSPTYGKSASFTKLSVAFQTEGSLKFGSTALVTPVPVLAEAVLRALTTPVTSGVPARVLMPVSAPAGFGQDAGGEVVVQLTLPIKRPVLV